MTKILPIVDNLTDSELPPGMYIEALHGASDRVSTVDTYGPIVGLQITRDGLRDAGDGEEFGYYADYREEWAIAIGVTIDSDTSKQRYIYGYYSDLMVFTQP